MAFLPKTNGVALLFLVIVACDAANVIVASDNDAPKDVNQSNLHQKNSGSNLSDISTETKNHEPHALNITTGQLKDNKSPASIQNITIAPEPTTVSPNVTTTSPAPKPTTVSPNVTTTTPAPKPTTVSPNVTTTTPVPKPTTVSPNVTTTTPAPKSTTLSPNSSTTPAPTPTPPPTPAPQQNWSAPSFFGGMVLAFGIVAVGFVGYRFFYLGRGGAYHTL